MTDLEKEAIERMKDLMHTCEIGIEKHGEYDDLFQKDKEAIVTVLNLIERQQRIIEEQKSRYSHLGRDAQKAVDYTFELNKEIEKYKEMYAVSIADRVNNAFKQEHKNNEDLEMLYKGCQIELEKKDMIIALMAEQLTTPIHSKEWVIEYYTKKVETEEK